MGPIPLWYILEWPSEVDSLAKTRANDPQRANMIPKCFLSYNEFKSKTKNFFKQKLSQIKSSILCMSRNSSRLLLRLRLNSWNIKYVKDVKCVCGEEITIKHYYLNAIFYKIYIFKVILIQKFFSDINILLYDDKIF